MPSLIAYRKVSDAITTHQLKLPTPEKHGTQTGQELATLEDGRTIVALFDGQQLPTEQPAPIKDSIEVLALPLPAELNEAIRAASPHAHLISRRVQDRIRAKYSAEEELKLNRIGTHHAMGLSKASAEDLQAIKDFGAYVEQCRAWGRAERAKLGL